MTETVLATSSPAPVPKPTSPKKKVVAGQAKPAASSHPSTAIMVTAAIKQLNEKKGSTLQAIKKYLAATYEVDSGKLAPFIRKFLKAAVTKGLLVQTDGSGASGHFKLSVEVKKSAPKKKVVAKKPAAVKKAAPAAVKKRKSTVKKSKAEPAAKKTKKEVVASKPKVAAKPAKSPAKAKKVPATKTKAPKAKKTPVKKTTPKKK